MGVRATPTKAAKAVNVKRDLRRVEGPIILTSLEHASAILSATPQREDIALLFNQILVLGAGLREYSIDSTQRLVVALRVEEG
jgi:hypothetical protein